MVFIIGSYPAAEDAADLCKLKKNWKSITKESKYYDVQRTSNKKFMFVKEKENTKPGTL